MSKFFKKVGSFITAASVTLLAIPAAHAAGTYDGITGAVDWSEVTAAVVAIGALIAAVYVVVKGVRMVLRAIKSA